MWQSIWNNPSNQTIILSVAGVVGMFLTYICIDKWMARQDRLEHEKFERDLQAIKGYKRAT